MLTFGFENKQHQVHFLEKDGKLWFGATEITRILETDHVDVFIKRFGLENNEDVINDQQVITITYSGVCTLAVHCQKPVGKSFQEWLIVTMNEKEKLDWERHTERKILHKTLLEVYDEKYIVYLGFIKMINGKMLIKIGKTKHIRTTFNQRHPADYGEIYAMYAGECQLNDQFETFLLKHEEIISWLYKEPVKVDGRKSIEVVLVTNDELNQLMEIIKTNIGRFQSLNDFNRGGDMTGKIEMLNSKVNSLNIEVLNKRVDELQAIVSVSSEKPLKYQRENAHISEEIKALINTPEFRNKCPKCYKVIKKRQRLMEHLKKKNPCDKVCPACSTKFANQRDFHSHRKKCGSSILK